MSTEEARITDPQRSDFECVLQTVRIRQEHPLHRFFAELMERHLILSAGINDIEAARYIAALLVDFTHVDSLYRVRNAAGKRLEEVGEMLLESNPLLGGRSFFYEREVVNI